MNRSSFRNALGALCLPLAGCDYTGDWLFPSPTEIPGVLDLGTLVPSDVSGGLTSDAILYGEVGANGSAEAGGVTFAFRGTGSSVCLWVDPELAYWSESIAIVGGNAAFRYPDNNFDDGDLDLFAGFSVYYTGTPGERIGGFVIQYEDSLGNSVPVELNECVIANYQTGTNGHYGRGAPEFCTLEGTQPNVSYTVLMESFSTPLDDDRLGFGLIVANGPCSDLIDAASPLTVTMPAECVILGEANDISTTVIGEDGSIIVGDSIEGSEDFEKSLCNSIVASDAPKPFETQPELPDFCLEEASLKNCAVETCFCGDPSVSPTAGQ